MVRRHQPKAFEVLQCRRGRSAEPARFTDISNQGRQRDMVVYLETALDPAPKLWSELTVDDRQTAVLSGHAAGFNRRTRLCDNVRSSA